MQLAFGFGHSPAGMAYRDNTAIIGLANGIIDGRSLEPWVDATVYQKHCGALTTWQHDDELWGAGFVDVVEGDFAGAATALYRDVFAATRDLKLHRVWNLIPHIHQRHGALDSYQAFCEGRYQAFDEHFGASSERHMPAASAMGTPGGRLCVAFVAGQTRASHIENPQQVPAYRYPSRYGPRAPSFARATLVQRKPGPRLYVSGTASIRNSESLHAGDPAAQCDVALTNVDLVARTAGLEDGLNAASPGQRHFRVYLRHPEHWAHVRPVFQQRLCRSEDPFTVLQADLCREELLVEVEACVDLM